MATRIPITKEKFGFDESRGHLWDDMERDMESRRREWEDEIDKMSSDFFTLRPETDRRFHSLSDKFSPSSITTEPRGQPASIRDDGKAVIEKDDVGNPVFRVRFDVSDYKPDEVNVKMDSNKMQVHARHEQKDGGKSVSREFTREINIPREIDPLSLQCAISKEGILCVEAPYPTPQYSVTSGPTSTPGLSQTHIQAPKYQSQPPPPPPPATQPPYQTPVYNPPSYQPPTPQPQPQTPPIHSSSYRSVPTTVHHEMFTQPPQHQPFQNMQSPPGAPFQSSGFQHQFPSTIGTPSRLGSSAVSSPITIQKDTNFKVEIDIEDFAPEELTVKTLDKKVVVSGRREVKEANRSSTKELSREYNIPETVDPITVKAFFTDGGKLIVEAPFKSSSNGGYGH